MQDDINFLAWFLGPKSENSTFLEESTLLILRDYFHWRRNYFSSDNIVLSRKLQRHLEPQYDTIQQHLLTLLAELRRNFPFYSPRYFGHMLSDTLLTSFLGYVAGMMYNPNNVTPEAAPVTVDLEIDACNALLRMLGFPPPPVIPSVLDESTVEKYRKSLQNQFGWGHLTHGGTTANLEALWVARTVRYAPLAIWDISIQKNIDIDVKLPTGEIRDIRDLTARQMLGIKPNESIYLLGRFVDALRQTFGLSATDAGQYANELLSASKYHLNRGVGSLYAEFPPVIFVAGSAHYSIQKAADILGIGKNNIISVDIDSSYRMDIDDLERRIGFAMAENKVPIAVVSIVGTTEEGAVDPVHKVLDVRSRFESHQCQSFWIHVDGAWGGYMRSLFNFPDEDELGLRVKRLSQYLGIQYQNPSQWHEDFFRTLNGFIEDTPSVQKGIHSDVSSTEQLAQDDSPASRIMTRKAQLEHLLQTNNYHEYVRLLKKTVHDIKDIKIGTEDFDIRLDDRIEFMNNYVSEVLSLKFGKYSSDVTIRWGAKDVCSAMIGMSQVDSITVDPHKMGYVNYPCGMIAFRNDRVRHFIVQKAPYITSSRQNVLVHMPPQHISESKDGYKVAIEAFAPFIVEGSRPGAAAAALWLTIKTLPPTTREGGSIVRTSLLSARHLYEWLVHWDKVMMHNQSDTDYLVVPLTPQPPDTNIVIFAVKKKTSSSLSKMNELTRFVYDRFTIQAELGDREYSYTQPFFLSKTVFEEPNYPFDSIRPILSSYFGETIDRARSEYRKDGLTVLRATVMNPYIRYSQNSSGQEILVEFMTALANAASESVNLIHN